MDFKLNQNQGIAVVRHCSQRGSNAAEVILHLSEKWGETFFRFL